MSAISAEDLLQEELHAGTGTVLEILQNLSAKTGERVVIGLVQRHTL